VAVNPEEHLENMQQLMEIFMNEPLLDALMEAESGEDILKAEAEHPMEEDDF
jgi:PTS system ascorbate-specific IIA component